MLRLDRAPRWFGRTPAAGMVWLVGFVSYLFAKAFTWLLMSFADADAEIWRAVRLDRGVSILLVVVGIAWALGRARGWLSVSSGFAVWIIALGVALRVLTSLASVGWETWPAGEQAWGDVASEIVPACRLLGLIAVVLGVFFLLAEVGYAWWLIRSGRRGLLDV